MKEAPAGDIFEFGQFRVDTRQRLLLRDGTAIPILPKSFDVLVALLRRRGELVDKASMFETVWPGTIVEENSLAKAISDVRKALGDDPRSPRFILTVAGHGYRFAQALRPGGASPAVPSAAVLPFNDLGVGAGHEHLTIGLADALITRLSRLPSVIVRPTGSILKYATRDKDPLQIARELGVDFVLDGSIRRSGDRVRVSVQLVGAERGGALWADTFDEPVSDLFAVEDSISSRVAGALAHRLSGSVAPAIPGHQTRNADAYQLYLEGRFFWSKRTGDGCHRAIACFERAIALDPRYALAHVGLADSWVMLGLQVALMGGEAPLETMPRAKAAIARALALDDSLAEVHASLGQIGVFYDWDWPVAERAFQRSLALNPHYLNARHWYAMALSHVGRVDEGLVEMRHALELDPFSPYVNGNYGRLLHFARRHDEAIAHLERTLARDPGFAFTRFRMGLAYEGAKMFDRAIDEYRLARSLSNQGPLATGSLAYALARAGRRQDSQALLDELLVLSTKRYVSASSIADVHLALGNRDVALDWLTKAVDERANAIGTIRVNPRYDELRGDPRFDDLIVRIWKV
jgi:TolB-like protein/tetratricopeptide (TPR) repeat protein